MTCACKAEIDLAALVAANPRHAFEGRCCPSCGRFAYAPGGDKLGAHLVATEQAMSDAEYEAYSTVELPDNYPIGEPVEAVAS